MKKFLIGLAFAMTTLTSAFSQSDITIPTVATSDDSAGNSVPELPNTLTDRQVHVLTMAYEIAKEDGHADPQILQGIVLQESSAGASGSYKVVVLNKSRYYGLTQLTIGAARDVIRNFPELKAQFGFQTSTNEELIAKLIENDEFNLSVASKYLLILKRFGFDTIRQLALAYNQGPGGARMKDARTFAYSNGVMKHIQSLHIKTTMR
jgi:hypothetical protein